MKQTEIKDAITSTNKQLIVLKHKLEKINLSSDEKAKNTKSKVQALQRVEEERSAIELSRKLLNELLSKSQKKIVAKVVAENKSDSIIVTFDNDNSRFQASIISGEVNNLTFEKK